MNFRVVDGAFPAELVKAAAESWPVDSPAWHRYNSPLERKAALNDWTAMPESVRALLRLLLAYPAWEPLGLEPLVPDVSLWGAGLHELAAGGHLDVHLDSDRHPHSGYERRANAILFLHDWDPAWGGALEFWSPDVSTRQAEIYPALNRLVLFETSDASPHGNPAPVQCPPGWSRKSLACYWWGLPRGEGQRPRARFLATPGDADTGKHALRAQRAT